MIKTIFPLSNGVGLFDNNKLCVGIINNEGIKKVGSFDEKQESKFFKLPFIRGIFYLLKGLFLFIKSFLFQYTLDIRKKEDKNLSYKWAGAFNAISGYFILIALVISSFLFGFLLLGLLPKWLFELVFDKYSNYYFQRFIIALLRFSLLYLIVLLIKFIPYVNNIFAFNGAGNIYLSNNSKFVGRCYPMNFLNFIINVLLFSVFMVSLIAVNVHWLANFFINLSIFLLVCSLMYEFLNLLTKGKNAFIKDLWVVFGHLVTLKPSATNTEVLNMTAIEHGNSENLKDLEKDDIPMSIVFAEMETKLKTCERFEKSDMEWIVATILNKSRAEIKIERAIKEKQYREIMRATERRCKGEPLSSIFGFVEFYGLKFDVNKKVLSPRLETEILVENAIKKIKSKEFKTVCDMCCGSGAIAITISKLTDAKVDAIDISKQALTLAKSNCDKNHAQVQFILSDLFKELKKNKKYDIIISNPPYIKSDDIEKLDIEVKKYDPKLALDGGKDGLEFYRLITSQSKKHLNKDGYLFYEVGKGQAQNVANIMKDEGFTSINIIKDYNKIERVVYGRISK